jgi:hypothetical protein
MKVEIYLDFIDKVATLEVVYAVENIGIGRYEFWGFDFLDTVDSLILERIELLKDGISDEEYDLVFGIIEHLDSDDELYQDIIEIIYDKID